MVIGQGELPQIFISAYPSGGLLGGIVNDLAYLLAVRNQSLGKKLDAEISLGRSMPGRAFWAERLLASMAKAPRKERLFLLA
jgi:hypothetical protein